MLSTTQNLNFPVIREKIRQIMMFDSHMLKKSNKWFCQNNIGFISFVWNSGRKDYSEEMPAIGPRFS